jgi:pantetheine-phosphate adenylyltransferase
MAQHALFSGTFDPVTLGHLDVLERAVRLFGRVTLGVALNPAKEPLFPLEERMSLLREVTAGIEEVGIVHVTGLTVDTCAELGADVIVRGVRGSGDLDYETPMAHTNRRLSPNIETVFLLPAPEHAFISSSLVRQVAQLGGDCSSFVPPAVLAALKQRFSN